MRAVHVLLVEDNPADTAYTRAILDGDEFRTTAVTCLAEAVEAAQSEKVDIVVLDMTLPDSTGLAALARLQELLPKVPIVILSGLDDEWTAMAAVQAGAQDYLLKGHISDVSLRRALRYAIERNELNDRLAASIDELERQRASVLHLNALKNDLIAVLAHDIKGPLTSIVGFAELLEEGFLEGEAAADAARTIRSNAQRLATLANDVLSLSRVEHGDLEIADDRVDLVALVKKAMELHASERALEFSSELATAHVRGDAERLHQVFDNLLRNAIKYSPGGEPIVLRLSLDGERFRLAIADRGIGIPAGEISQLFDRFTRASNARKAKIAGTGIGLFIVKMIVERHGGEIAVNSTLGEGSTFFVMLPTIEASGAQRPMRVTILTFDRALSRFAAYELRARGFRVREAITVEDAVMGDIRSGDVMIVDEGVSTARELRELLRKDLRVHLVGLGGENVDEWDTTLPKPFLVTDLLRAVSPNGQNALVRQ